MNPELSQWLLYARGVLYLAIGVMMLVISMAPSFRDHRWHIRIVAVFFFILSAGGMSSLLQNPQIGRDLINYGATGWAFVILVMLSRWLIFRK